MNLRKIVFIITGIAALAGIITFVYASIDRSTTWREDSSAPTEYVVNRIYADIYEETDVESEIIDNRINGQSVNVIGISKDHKWAKIEGKILPSMLIIVSGFAIVLPFLKFESNAIDQRDLTSAFRSRYRA